MDQQNFNQQQYQNNPYANQNIYGGGQQQPLDNATTIMVLGICSIAICGLGPILGLITLILSRGATTQYNANPAAYTQSSYKNVQTGKICGIIGLCVWTAAWLCIIAYYIYMYFMVMTLMNELENMQH